MSLFICGVLTLASLYYVFLFPGEVFSGEEKTRLGYLRERKEAVYDNLRDLNFEHKAGKVPEADYDSVRILCAWRVRSGRESRGGLRGPRSLGGRAPANQDRQLAPLGHA